MPRAAADTPMQEQYRRLKAECGDAFLFFRLGDFYELFGEDAERAAPVLEVVLTSRDIGTGTRQPMCGVPHHALGLYLGRMLARGHSVAIAEQTEDPALARGLVRREITRFITPGTVNEPELLETLGEGLLVAVCGTACAAADVSTGALRVPLLADEQEAEQELGRLAPREVVVPAGAVPAFARRYAASSGAVLTERPPDAFDPAAPAACWPGAPADPALGGLLAYLRHTVRGELGAFRAPETYQPSAFVGLDALVRRNLELVERLAGGSGGTLLSVCDRCVTAMGRRLLRLWLLHPLRELEAIRARQDALAELVQRPLFREGLRAALRGVYDLERLAARTIAGRASPRELAALGASLRSLPAALRALEGCGSALLRQEVARVDPLHELGQTLGRALADELPVQLRDGGVFAPGWDALLDELRAAGTEGRSWLAELEGRERERTGIKSLKIGFNKVFGYFLEVSRPNLGAVPPEYRRKQTTAGGERFVTSELRELEERILGAEEKALRREALLFTDLRAGAAAQGQGLQRTAGAVAVLDALASLAAVAAAGGWIRPVLDRSHDLVVRAGRHAVLEQSLGAGRFVPNDLELGPGGRRVLVLTGPNMGGKSTYMRQAALIAILAHCGSFVPAAAARVGLIDQVFTRVGASDDLFGGRSTFMVEMTEVASCLRQATARSLILLDEVGRGTGTLDGLSIAWAVLEDIAGRLHARTLFATHYHELAAATARLPAATNAHVTVREQGEGIVFLHRVLPGATDRSYGVAVAKLAGVPPPVIRRARELLARLQAGGAALAAAAEPGDPVADPTAALAAEGSALLARLAAVDPLRLTPLQALDLLAVLQAEAAALRPQD